MSPFLRFALLLIGYLLPSLSFAQSDDHCIIRGTVRDSATGESLVGVNIYLKDNYKGTTTDAFGFYKIEVPSENSTIVFSYLGYDIREIKRGLCDKKTRDITLKPAETEIPEVKITAQRKFFGNMNYGREIPTISADVIAKENTSNASDILHAKIAGVWATKTSGSPGDHQKIRIRGQTSFFSSAEPLYVVDGIPVPIVNLSSLGIADLNVHDIESVTVLKDASSTALYGFQGANGVVLIDTKQGGEKKTDFCVKTGIQWFNNFYDFLSAKEQINILDEAYNNMQFIMHDYYPEITDSLCNRDWQDFIFSPGKVWEYQLSTTGKLKKVDYYLSGNFTDHTGIVNLSNYKRYNFSSRVGRNFKRFAVGLVYRYSHQLNKDNQDEYLGNRLIWEGITKSPSLECTDDSLIYHRWDGTVNLRALNYYQPLKKKELPQELIDSNFHKLTINTQTASAFGRIEISDHLSIDIMESLMLRNTNYNAKFDYYRMSYYSYGSQLGFEMQSDEEVILFNHQANLSYYNTWQDHNVSFVFAHRYYKDNLWWQIDTLKGTLDDNFALKNSMAGYGPNGSVLRNLSSYIGHGSYSYKNKYFISLIANLSHIREGVFTDYYSMFPSVALSWDIARETYFKPVTWLNECKLFANWGLSGNYPLNSLANDLYVSVVYPRDGYPVYYRAIDQLSNHHLRHENVNENDLGLKTSLFSDRLKLIGTFYQKRIDNLIIQRDIPKYYGGGKIFMNLAEIDVSGFEISLEAVPVHTTNFAWQISANFSQSDQLVKKLDREKSILYDDPDILIPEFMIREGESLGDIYGYRFLGQWTARDDADTSNQYVELKGFKFLNTDTSDAELTESDKVSLGNALPKFICNFSSSMQYRNMGIDMQWYAAIGQEKYNATYAAAIMAAVHRDVIPLIQDTLRILGEDAYYESSEFIENASFVRLKTLSFWYSPDLKFVVPGKLTLTLSFENLLTFTRYRGYDPEATIFTDNNFSDNSIDRGAYPNPKAVYFSIKLDF